MARVDFFNLYGEKGDCICVIFTKFWFLKLPDKEMKSCETLKAMPKKGNSCFRGLYIINQVQTYVHSAIFYMCITRDRSKRDIYNKS